MVIISASLPTRKFYFWELGMDQPFSVGYFWWLSVTGLCLDYPNTDHMTGWMVYAFQ